MVPLRRSLPDAMHRRRFIQSMAGCAAGRWLARAAGRSEDWMRYGGDSGATRYSPLKQINAANVGGLKAAWVHRSAGPDSRYRGSVECTPIVVEGVMYIAGADLVVEALDAATGKLLWTFAPLAGGTNRRGFGVSRGVTYSEVGASKRIFAPVQNRIWCLDAK